MYKFQCKLYSIQLQTDFSNQNIEYDNIIKIVSYIIFNFTKYLKNLD